MDTVKDSVIEDEEEDLKDARLAMMRLSLSDRVKPAPKLNLRQLESVTRVREGHSVFITGPAGTGKSLTLRAITKELEALNKVCAITAPTGVAAINVGGQTIHTFFGLGELKYLSDFDKMWAKKKQIRNTDVLIFDEISMVSGMMFEVLELAVTCIRGMSREAFVRRVPQFQSSAAGSKRGLFTEDALRCRWKMPTATGTGDELGGGFGDLPAWGGMQLVIVGDFFQLPPVNPKPKKLKNMNASAEESKAGLPFRAWGFAFECNAWWESQLCVIQLNQVFRQHGDDGLLAFLHDVRVGNGGEQKYQSIRQYLTRNNGILAPRPDNIKPTKLFATNVSVDATNQKELAKLTGTCYTFMARDQVGLLTAWKKKRLRTFRIDGAPLSTQFDYSNLSDTDFARPDCGKVVGGFMPIWRDPDEKSTGMIVLEKAIAEKERQRQTLFKNKIYTSLPALDHELADLTARLEVMRNSSPWLVSMQELTEWMTQTVQSFNTQAMDTLPHLLGKIHAFQKCLDKDRKQLRGQARKNYFSNCKVEEKMLLKKDAQVMLLVNEDVDRGLANGSRGVVVEIVETAHYIAAIHEEAMSRSNDLGDFDLKKRKLDGDRLVRANSLCKEEGLSAKEAHARVEVWYNQMLEKLEADREAIRRARVPLAGVSEAVSRAINNMSEVSFLEEQRRVDCLDAQKWPVVPMVKFTNGVVYVFTPRTFRTDWPCIGFAARTQIPLKKAWYVTAHVCEWLERVTQRLTHPVSHIFIFTFTSLSLSLAKPPSPS